MLFSSVVSKKCRRTFLEIHVSSLIVTYSEIYNHLSQYKSLGCFYKILSGMVKRAFALQVLYHRR